MRKKKEDPVTVKIYLDDLRKPPVGFIGVKTPKDCINWLELCHKKGTIVKILSLDHDLGLVNPVTLEEETGYDVLVWLENNTWALPREIRLHTSNPVGRRRMQLVIDAMERRSSGLHPG